MSAKVEGTPRDPGCPKVCNGYFGERWHGRVPLAKVFWRDMLLVGTIVNFITTLFAVILLVADAPVVLVVMIFFSPLPFNAFLVVAVWRSADAAAGRAALVVRTAAIAWFVAVTAL